MIILVKIPVGLNQVITMLKNDSINYCVSFVLNSNYADGLDTSLIWDGNLEELPFNRINKIITGGERGHDFNFCFQVAGAPEARLWN
ncbi:DUF1727 domain-containing protein [Bombilactobacillus bombi]|uniref:DUF1727 domain-containing protein n=1 Tax=Bombilactobacillus bombi TaxID=1303590 RepID=UPI0015E5E1BB|nr:DUF1727 domain-containing protein [Bombilactobacillus bombi]MBA1433905.1 DUF1727 domain-containing protein [Bombilactobacillus bombi]